MRKIYRNFILFFCFAVILSGCGSGLCPLRTSAGACISSGSGWSGAIGVLDTSFNGTGIVTTPVGAGYDYAYSSLLQPDGKIIAVGNSYNGANQDFAIVRYNSNGSLDTSFNGTGIATSPVLAGAEEALSSLLQPDGKVIAVGYAHNGLNDDFALVRFNSNGSVDTSFNGTGIVTTAIFAGADQAYSSLLQPDGKIIAVGYTNNAGNNDFALVRYNANGSLDTSFNGTGIVTTPVLASGDEARSALLQPDGKIIAVGSTNNAGNNDFALVRYNSNGSLDTSFNGTGIVTTPVLAGADVAFSSLLQPDGKIIAVGYAYNGANVDFALVRYNSNGSLDTTFNGTGIVTTPILASDDQGFSSSLQPDGKIIVAGYISAANHDFGVARYNANGSLDTTFNGTGKITTPVLASDDRAHSCLLQTDGKIIVTGYLYTGVNNDFVLVRYR